MTHQWKRKWVVLRQCQLSYYKDSREYKPRRVIPRLKILSYNVIPDDKKNHFAIYTTDKVFDFKCDDDKLYNKWITALDSYLSEQDILVEDVQDDADVDSEDEEQEEVRVEEQIVEQVLENSKPKMIISDEGITADEFSSDLTETAPGVTATDAIESMAKLTINPKPKHKEQPKDTHTDEEYIIEKGHLQILRSKYNHQWKKYYVILTTKNLSFYKSDEFNSRPRKTFTIEEIYDVIELERHKHIDGYWCLLIITPLKRIRVRGNDEGEMMRWFSALKAICIRTRKRGDSL
ncbi:hypothetical protein JA1_004916 [Spathaspora sp. JA1]|nr:hypothetical protein JA1_004916 [Spathaspora sp. JA1]